MTLRYVLDENLRGALWQAIQQHNLQGAHVLDATRVGDPPDLPLGTSDPDLLVWAECEGRLLVSLDKKTLLGHLAQHLQAGHHSPGILLVTPGSVVPAVLGYLVLAAHAGDPAD
ncbi:MAG: DUF5615 family PIN-like protein, partial [Planctomycetes bacterium]|nr:DUF5615 family PIN-like protein [Planctomycetota bacterium]